MLRTNAHLFEFNSHSKHWNNKDHHLVRIQQCDLRKRIGLDFTVFLLYFDYYASVTTSNYHRWLSNLNSVWPSANDYSKHGNIVIMSFRECFTNNLPHWFHRTSICRCLACRLLRSSKHCLSQWNRSGWINKAKIAKVVFIYLVVCPQGEWSAG